MQLNIPRNRRLVKALGESRTRYLERGVNAIGRILPHIETLDWEIGSYEDSHVDWLDNRRREILVRIGIQVEKGYSIRCRVRRKKAPAGVGAIARTLDTREKAICEAVVEKLAALSLSDKTREDTALVAMDRAFDELVVAAHLKSHHGLELDPERLFRAIRGLAEQTYENNALTFGCIVDPSLDERPPSNSSFPDHFLSKKRFRALTDGYNTAYLISNKGHLTEFVDLSGSIGRTHSRSFFPEWCRDLAIQCRGGRIGFALTRHGDILILGAGTLRFTYRLGKWQYWNHTHLVDLLKNSARVQRVPRQIIPSVVNSIYRAALDVSFRRTGALFVILRNRKHVDQLVRAADRIGHHNREPLNNAFDAALPNVRIQQLPRSLVVELAALDGAIVVNNHGELMAYGAVLDPNRRGRVDVEEGSRTKAAIGASNYGLAIKVSADGDIAVYLRGKEFIRI